MLQQSLIESEYGIEEQLALFRSHNGKHWFQTFSENTRCGDKKHDPLARHKYDTLANCEFWFYQVQLNHGGCFIQLQDVYGRKAVQIKHARFIFIDFDHLDILPPLPLKPSMIVKTPNGFHVYYAIEYTTDIARWQRINKNLVKSVGGDPTSSQPNKVVRLVGYDHNKQNPIKIGILDYSPHLIYQLDDFSEFDSSTARLEPSGNEIITDDCQFTLDFALARAILNDARSKVIRAKKGERYHTLLSQNFRLAHYIRFGIEESRIKNMMFSVLNHKLQHDWIDLESKAFQYAKVINDSIQDGYKDSFINIPFIPEEQLAVWENVTRQNSLLSGVGNALPEIEFTITDLKSLFPQYANCFTDKQFEITMGKTLKSLGYAMRRSNGKRLWGKSGVARDTGCKNRVVACLHANEPNMTNIVDCSAVPCSQDNTSCALFDNDEGETASCVER